MFISTYTVVTYVNGRLAYRTRGLSKRAAYDTAVVGEALHQIPGGRWNTMLYPSASEKMDLLLVGETLRVCWQEYNPDFDTEHTLIMREEDYYENFITSNNMIQ